MNTNCEKVNKIMAIVIDASITKEQAMEVLRVKYEWLYPYITNGVWDDHYGLYLKSKGSLLETKCGCVIMRDSREHDECRCDDDGENWICAGCYNGEYDDKPECCGKHCDETEGLKLGMGWNRWHLSVTDMITEQLWCENCYKDYVGNEDCRTKPCSEDSEFMCELIDCATCKRPTMRKDMYWKEGGCCMTDLCEDCAPKVPAPRQPECCGKHCDETEGLKLGMGWNRCSCGCGVLGGSCDRGVAIDNNECTNCRDPTCDEAYKFSRGAEVMVLCDNCGGDWYNGIWEKDGWKRV